MKTVLITGATSGIGRATALALAKRNFGIVFIARNLTKAEELIKEIKNVSYDAAVDYIIADLSSLNQVRKCAESFRKKYQQLDVLINNAGICLPERRITVDGLEETFQVNHLSHFLLTYLLTEELKNTPASRVINVSSAVYKNGVFDAKNFQSEHGFNSFGTYSNTKLLNILFTVELAERLRSSGTTVNTLHPGVVKTNFGSEMKGFHKTLSTLFSPFLLTPEFGATTSVYLASSDDVKNISGKYFEKCKVKEYENEAVNAANRKILWEKSLQLCGLWYN